MIRYNTKRYWGYSTETKPKNAQIGDRFLVLDTNSEYFFSDYNEWVLISTGGGGGGVSGDYLPLSGGTVTGATVFNSGLTANNLTVTGNTLLSGLTTVYGNLNVSGLTQTSGLTSTGGVIFPQKTVNSTYTATTSDYMIDVTGGTFTVQLPTAVGVQGKLYAIKNNGGGAVTVLPFGSEKLDDKSLLILSETNAVQLVSNGSQFVILGQDRSTVNNSTGVFEFSGLSIASTSTFNVAPVKGWIVDVTSNPLSPQILYVEYSGGTHTAIYLTTDTGTWVYLTSGGTISQSNTPLDEQQRRQNIFLGKLGHANKTSLINAFSQPDFVLSPLAQLRDMFEPINLINGGVYPSANTGLTFNTSAGYLHGLGINFASTNLSPNEIYVSGNTPCTFQYRTQTGGTASNTTLVDPANYDVGGVVTPVSGVKATNQRIFLIQNGQFRIQYGQHQYTTLAAAISAAQNETYNTFINFQTNGILIGILSVMSNATVLNDTDKAQFLLVSKFGETVGAAGGLSTTTLQQAYNNSSNPEISTNNTLGALGIKNGTGNADNVSNLLEGIDSSSNTTSYIRADGAIYGNSLSAVTVSATTLNANTLVVQGDSIINALTSETLTISALTSSVDTRYLVSNSNGDVSYRTDVLTGSSSINSGIITKSFGIVIDGGGSTITTGIKSDLISPYNMIINSWTLVADAVGSIVVDLWKDTYANFPPTVSDTIITGGTGVKPYLSSTAANQSTGLTGWNVSISSGDIIRFNVDSATTVKKITLSLNATLV